MSSFVVGCPSNCKKCQNKDTAAGDCDTNGCDVGYNYNSVSKKCDGKCFRKLQDVNFACNLSLIVLYLSTY